MEEEIERQLDAKAAKSNLTATNVKNILKHVISNEHVREMLHQRMTNGEDGIVFEPKLTRAKAKELAMTHPEIPWPITPVKEKTSEVQVFIQKEFSEDSSDEEYHPDQDQQSDDDKDIENSIGSDFDSQPSTPATPGDLTVVIESPKALGVKYDDDGIFKVPLLVPHVPTEEESIGHRTRSKLCLNETPLEQIEQAFIPPDITSDMYDWEPEDEYLGFLKELYYQPVPKEVNIDDDPEADPEYNILEDEEIDILDKEELREDKAVKVSKKELNSLIAELDEFATKQHEQHLEQQQQQQKTPRSNKKKTPDTSCNFIGNYSPENPMVHLLPVLAQPQLPVLVNHDQRSLLSVQMSQHVQLLVQQFVMTYKHPKYHQQSKICKNNLQSLITLSANSESNFLPQNLPDALKLVTDWESKLYDPIFSQEYEKYIEMETEIEKQFFNNRKKHCCRFHPELIKLMANSKALMHSQLLPDSYPNSLTSTRKAYLKSEEHLIAIGLEQFIPYAKSTMKMFCRKCDALSDAVSEIQRYLVPIHSVPSILSFIRKCNRAKTKDNPIKSYFSTGLAPRTIHRVLSQYKLLPPKSQSIKLLSPVWRNILQKLKSDNLDDFLTIPKAVAFELNKQINCDTEFFPIHDEISVPKNHELRNPVVNMLRNMPSLITPKKCDSANSPTKNSDNANPKPVQTKVNETESDVESAESFRACETDEDESRPTRLRMTTPRLAKIKSAQNMKILAQTLSPKASSSSHVSDSKEDSFDKSDDNSSTFTKGDDEDEIAELMLASTTIKKNSASRKKTKQARELENSKRFFEAENNVNEHERATKFATSFIHKMNVKLESKDPELFKTILKFLVDYNEKLENLNQADSADFEDEITSKDIQIVCKKDEYRDKLAVELYRDVCEKFHEYPDLCNDFLLFLTPHQAALIDKSVEHTMLLKMKEFINVTQMYFAKQPSRIAKLMQAITQMASDPFITVEKAQEIMGTVLKGHPLIMDMFLQVLPTGKPPDSVFAAHMFENLLCTVGPHDKNKMYDTNAPELYENIELPISTPQEDPYGGDNCKCECHNLGEDSKSKNLNEHCASCGTRFLNGRVYLQTSEGLRPAKITFPGADDEKLENISRVSLKTTERLIPSQPATKRRKSTKRDSISEDTNVKSSSSKGSPTKDNEDDRLLAKSKKGTKSPKTSDSKKMTKIQSPSVRGKREKKTEKKDDKFDQKTDDDQNEFCVNVDQTEFDYSNSVNEINTESDSCGKFGELSTDSHEDDTMTSPEKLNISSTSIEKLDVSSDSDSSANIDTEMSSAETPWSMQEDKILLENVQRDYSEETFQTVSSILGNRSVEQVKERCEYLLSLIEKMA